MNDKEFKEWEEDVEKAKSNNHKLLLKFEIWLKQKKLSKKTIKKHTTNVDFFINGFLLRYEIIPAEEGTIEVGSFLGGYFIHNTTWSSKNTINENITSFKKFYTFLNENGNISKEELDEMISLIKEEKEYWIEEVERF